MAAFEAQMPMRSTFRMPRKIAALLDQLGSSHQERLIKIWKRVSITPALRIDLNLDRIFDHSTLLLVLFRSLPAQTRVHLNFKLFHSGGCDASNGQIQLLMDAFNCLTIEKLILVNSEVLFRIPGLPDAVLTPRLKSLRIQTHNSCNEICLNSCTLLHELIVDHCLSFAPIIKTSEAPSRLQNALFHEVRNGSTVQLAMQSAHYPWVEFEHELPHGLHRYRELVITMPQLQQDYVMIYSLRSLAKLSATDTFRFLEWLMMHPLSDIVKTKVFRGRYRHNMQPMTRSSCQGLMLLAHPTRPTDVQQLYTWHDVAASLTEHHPHAFYAVIEPIPPNDRSDYAAFPDPVPIVMVDHSHGFTVKDYGTLIMTWYKKDIKLSGLLPLLPLLTTLRVLGVSISDASIARIMVHLAMSSDMYSPHQAQAAAHMWSNDHRATIDFGPVPSSDDDDLNRWDDVAERIPSRSTSPFSRLVLDNDLFDSQDEVASVPVSSPLAGRVPSSSPLSMPSQ
eukprot:TRINITY_DN3031_c0_g1_i1.p1 TRINITY_DN3031_c0_g1~~TRINITY_DN3031_c0_g1_i1.p1  ORF type:complete len:560 (+),score=45.33 TRINITY_DN3031_c0_g1_i1:163-1680(+)